MRIEFECGSYAIKTTDVRGTHNTADSTDPNVRGEVSPYSHYRHSYRFLVKYSGSETSEQTHL